MRTFSTGDEPRTADESAAASPYYHKQTKHCRHAAGYILHQFHVYDDLIGACIPWGEYVLTGYGPRILSESETAAATADTTAVMLRDANVATAWRHQ